MRAKGSSSSRAFYITGAILLGIVVLAFLVSLVYTPYDVNMTDVTAKLMPPSPAHLFGTDNFGRDVFSRVLAASKYTIFISVAGVLIAAVLGIVTGLPAGYYGNMTDRTIMLFNNAII